MAKNKKSQQPAPEMVEQVLEVAQIEATITEEQLSAEMEAFFEGSDEPPFGEDLPTTLTNSNEEVEEQPEAEEQTEEQKKGYRVLGTSRICDLKVGQQYKREDSPKCKTWTVVLKEEGEKPKMLVSSSPKNTHNPRKEFDMEVVVIETI